MAVYTTLTEREINSLLLRFALPNLQSFEGASSGVENTTYFLTLSSGMQYVLTVFESLSARSLDPYIRLMMELARHQLPVPCPLLDTHGAALQAIANKPALLFARARGKHIDHPEPDICRQVGINLAKIHAATITSPLTEHALANPCGLPWMKETLALVSSSLCKDDIKILQNQIDLSTDLETRGLDRAIIHGDLFRDNVLVEGGAITAIIDFYNSGVDITLIDLAITANDWCYALKDTDIVDSYVAALVAGYQMIRPLRSLDTTSWRDSLCVAAARLWLSRQKRLVLAQKTGRKPTKDPNQYKLLLLQHINTDKSSYK